MRADKCPEMSPFKELKPICRSPLCRTSPHKPLQAWMRTTDSTKITTSALISLITQEGKMSNVRKMCRNNPRSAKEALCLVGRKWRHFALSSMRWRLWSVLQQLELAKSREKRREIKDQSLKLTIKTRNKAKQKLRKLSSATIKKLLRNLA